MKKTITIKRKPNDTNLPDHIYASAKKRIGSSYTSSGTVNTGLNREETKKFMPDILDVDYEDRAFRKAVNKYFMDLSVEVPPAGLDLEIGVDKDKYPLNLEDYIKYRFCIVHPYVLIDVKSKTERMKKRKYSYFVEDHTKEKQIKVDQAKLRKLALKEYIKISDNLEKTTTVLRVMGLYPDSMDDETKVLELENLAVKDPAGFVTVVSNKDLETKSFIRKCLTAEVIRKVGNTYLDGEEVLGSSEEEVVLFLLDKKNSETLLTLKARLKEFSK